MKKIFLLIILAAAMQPLFAQSVKFGIKAGLNESTADLGKIQSTVSSLSGFNAGVFADVEFGKLTIEPAIFYTTKGYNTKTVIMSNQPVQNPDPYPFKATGKVAYNYLEVPINALYDIPVGPMKIFIGGGPYLGIALSGTRNGTTTVGGVTTVMPANNITFGSGTNDFSRTDFGINALAGITLKNGLLFSFDYGYGLTNTINRNNSQIKNRVLSLSVGYAFL
jgi:hypothetical protein